MKSILIVEDEIFIAMEIERALETAGHKVVAIAADRAEALGISDHIDLAFVDVNLRDGPTGPLIASELCERGTRVVFVTANPAQIGSFPAPDIKCIAKPFTDDAIISAVEISAN